MEFCGLFFNLPEQPFALPLVTRLSVCREQFLQRGKVTIDSGVFDRGRQVRNQFGVRRRRAIEPSDGLLTL